MADDKKMPEPRIVKGEGYEFEIRFVPCPPEQVEAYWHAMRILNGMILEVLAKKQQEEAVLPAQTITDDERNSTQ